VSFFYSMKLTSQIKDRKKAAEDYLSTKRELWDRVEKLFHNQLGDVISAGTKSQVFDPKLTTFTLERGYRVMAQLPTGKVKGISSNDAGTSKLMNLILDKYIVPNANAQFDFLTKSRMADIYSNVYGNFFALVDWDVKENGYAGPDMWLLNIRDVFPQVGAVSIEDSDYLIVRTWKPISYFENLEKRDGFKNIDKIVAALKKKSGSKGSKKDEETSQREGEQYPNAAPAKGMGYFEVWTQYEKDRWVDFCVDADTDFRDMKNPHENGELPIVCKHSIPLLDDFMGMGDFERGASLQKTINSVWNLYLDAVKMSIFPPALINKDNIASMSSIKWGAAEKWLVRGQINNAVQPLQLNPQGISTFNNTYQMANGALLNLFGTTDTAVTKDTDIGYGKTPKALNMQQKRENTRDNADRFYMEQFLKKVMVKMVNLFSKKQTGATTVRLFDEEIKELAKSYSEIEESYDEKSGKLTIDKKKTGSVIYDYEMVSGSTYAIDQQAQQQSLTMMLQTLVENPQLAQAISQGGYKLNIGELFKRIISNSGIRDWDKILEEMNEEDRAKQDEQILQQDAQAFLQAIQGGSINQVPLTPEGQP